MIEANFIQYISIIFYIVVLIIGIKKHFSLLNHITCFLLYFYIIIVISITVFPIPMHKELLNDVRQIWMLKNNFVPFKSMYEIVKTMYLPTILRQVGGNILLFVPLGYLVPIVFKKVSTINKVLLIGLSCSVGIELLQALISLLIRATYRVTDIDDVILNTIGTLIGFIMLKLTIPMVRNLFHLKKANVI